MNREPSHPVLLDPGWLFLVAGVGVLAATVLIPAREDLDEARHRRDVALAFEEHRQQRVARYHEYLRALERREPSLVYSLAASQLNQIPADRGMIGSIADARGSTVSVFPALEPDPIRLPERQKVESLLFRLTTQDRSRMWMLAGGMLAILLGLLPPTRRAAPDPRPEV